MPELAWAVFFLVDKETESSRAQCVIGEERESLGCIIRVIHWDG